MQCRDRRTMRHLKKTTIFCQRFRNKSSTWWVSPRTGLYGAKPKMGGLVVEMLQPTTAANRSTASLPFAHRRR
ncbi:Os08g0517750 [Oryza sativa Japonica Group]|uniref:Os08g0517750 protein n=1 Tax=Oryza sativa subsp. japonica TaxID=39947 RepID=A0A0P0XHN3_ORYSJ|nr:hypothetical protein EE612_045377 [Oryza sativa]BAT06257.1 Os08g0517750 [Oryza sativa Japonica Group]